MSLKQIARNVTMEGWGALRDYRYLLHHRDTKFTQSFRAIIASGRVELLALLVRSPDLNAYFEALGEVGKGRVPVQGASHR
jgi:putative transposase